MGPDDVHDGEYTWRAFGRADLDAWLVLLTAIEAVDKEDEHPGADELLEMFADPYKDFPRGSYAAFDADGVMVAYCTLHSRTAAEPVHEMWMGGAVHPAHRGRGLGWATLEWAERAAVPLHEERYPGRPLTLSGGSLVRNPDAGALFAERGYRQVRWFNGMKLDLSQELPESPVPADVVLVGFTPEMSEDALRVRNESFRDHWGSTDSTPESWARRIAESSFRPALSYLAYEAGAGTGEPLALVFSHEYEAAQQATGKRDLYIGLVGTRRPGRKRGIASALLTHVLRGGRAAGFDTASLGVDADSPTGALGLYERIGFRVSDTYASQHLPIIPVPSTGSDAP